MTDNRIAVLLIYPDSRAAALGSPGFKEVFRSLDIREDFDVRWSWFDEESGSVDKISGRTIGQYDVVGFSVAYELLYGNVIRALVSLGLEPEKTLRGGSDPLIILGGAAPTINPVVAGTIADIVYRGEAEHSLAEVIQSAVLIKTGAAQKLTPMRDGKPSTATPAAPRFFLPDNGIVSSFYDGFDDPSQSAFADAGLVEVGRGCSRGCRFCAAGHIYLPARQRPVEAILEDTVSYKGKAKRIGLVGAAVSDYRYLKEVMRGILDRGFGLTTSSFRADMLDEELATMLIRGGLKTVTIAPEGGSERMRRLINKRLDEDEIIAATHASRSAGFKNIRLYYMVGLPWETPEDIDAIVSLTGKIALAFSSPGSSVTVSVNPFIPKPETPFQWCPMAETSCLEDVYKRLARAFRSLHGVSLKTLSIRAAEREAVISLGDERVGKAVIANARNNTPWARALRDNGIDTNALIHRFKDDNEVFPWDSFTGAQIKAALHASFVKAWNAAQSLND